MAKTLRITRTSDGYARLIHAQCQAHVLPAPVAEYRFAPPRRWCVDFAWPLVERPRALEVEGGVWTRGRHTRGVGFERDCEKYAELAIRGRRLIRVTPAMVRDGRAIGWVERALAGAEGGPR